jgi:hypothetical protein
MMTKASVSSSSLNLPAMMKDRSWLGIAASRMAALL